MECILNFWHERNETKNGFGCVKIVLKTISAGEWLTRVAKFILILYTWMKLLKEVYVSHTAYNFIADWLSPAILKQNIDSRARARIKQMLQSMNLFNVSIHTSFFWNFELYNFLLGINAQFNLKISSVVVYMYLVWFLVLYVLSLCRF